MHDSPQLVADANAGPGQPLHKPMTLLFAALAVVWFFPSLIAISFLKPEPRTGPGYFRNVFETLATMDAFAWLLLAPAFVFAVLAIRFYWKEKSAANPGPDHEPAR